MSQQPRMFIPAFQPPAATAAPVTTTAPATQTSSQQFFVPGLASQQHQPPTAPTQPDHEQGASTTAPSSTSTLSQQTQQAMSQPPPAVVQQQQQQPQVPIVPCPAEIMRMTTNVMPITQSLLNKTGVPLGCLLHPLGEGITGTKVPVISCVVTGIVRCRMCRTYINPFVTFIDGGRRWRCNVCELTNDVPGDYFSPINPATGQRRDIAERPELTHGCVEFIAPGEYMVRAPTPPAYVFVIDASYTAVTSGLLASVAASLKQWVTDFKGHSRTRVAFLTYDNAIHYYVCKGSLPRPQMLVVSDLEAAANGVPALPEDLLVSLYDARPALLTLLDKLPSMFANTKQVGVAFGAAVSAGIQVCKHLGGKMMCFVSAAPSVGEGRTTNPAQPQQGMDSETAAQPTTEAAGDYYKNVALECNRYQITVDVYATASQFCDLATIGQLAQFTSGETIYMPGFDGRKAADFSAMARGILQSLARPASWEAVMRIRCSKGIKVLNHYGHFFVRSTDLLALPACDSGKSYAVQLQVSEQQQIPWNACVQNALLYTNSNGERRIRVATVCVPVTQNAADIYNNADSEAITGLIAKMAVDKLCAVKITDAREAILRKVVDMLYGWRLSVSTTGGAGGPMDLMIPDTMRNLPLYILALLKQAALMGVSNEQRADNRTAAVAMMRVSPLEQMLIMIHPHLFNLTAAPLSSDASSLPALNALSIASVDHKNIMLLNTGETLLIFAGKHTAQQHLVDLFGVGSLAEVPTGFVMLPELETELSVGTRSLVAMLQQTRESAGMMAQRVFVAVDDRHLAPYLIADRTRNFHSYHEFVAQLQRNIQQRINS